MTEKNIYSVFDRDTGKIIQSQKVFDDEGGAYGKVLRDREMRFVQHAGKFHADLSAHYVFKGELCDRQSMKVKIGRTTIGIGEANGTTLTGVPWGAVLTIFAGSTQFFSEKIDGTRVDIHAPVPGIYTLHLDKFPFRPWQIQVIAE